MRAIRYGICLIAAFSVLAFGAVEIWSVTLLEIGAALLFLWWALLCLSHSDIEIRWSPVFWPLLIFLSYVTLQSVWGATASPFLMRVALLKIASCSILFFLSVQAFRRRQDLRFLSWFLMLLAFAIGLFGIIQSMASNGELYWLVPATHGGSPIGPYVNRDHFAGLMELLVPVGLSLLLFKGVRREQIPLVGILTLVPVVALLLTGSRGGIASFVFEIGLLTVMVRRQTRKAPSYAVVAILLGALALGSWLGAGQLFDHLTQYRSGAISLERRWTMLEGTWHLFLQHPIRGSGLGTLIELYPRYETYYDGLIVNHAHNDYIELLAETGALGGLCGLAFLFLFFREFSRCMSVEQSPFSLGIHSAGIVACAGLLVHSFVDFNLHIPANGLMFFVLASFALAPTVPLARAHPPSDP